MLTISPIPRALLPVDSHAAKQLIGPNYDEFQSDDEIRAFLQESPNSILRVTMAHCDPLRGSRAGAEGSPEALTAAAENLRETIESDLTRIAENVLWLYEILDPRRPGVRQIGLGGAASTVEIKTEENPGGTIIRNEGIRPAKAAGRARLIEATKAYVGIVNNTVEDSDGSFAAALELAADSREPDFQSDDEHGNTHRVWLIDEPAAISDLKALLTAQGEAYVADGNHRSAAAAQLGRKDFLAVFFPASRMGLAPYNRLVKSPLPHLDELHSALSEHFDVEPLGDLPEFRPAELHTLGLYTGGAWLKLRVQQHVLDAADAAGSVDAAIVQSYIFERLLGISDPADERLTYVGGNKDSAYLKQQVDKRQFDFAISMSPVSMEQFIAVCRAQQFMPPKSTWFEPKVRSGLVMSLLE